ncbi:Factor of DNA methylation 2 [Linum perenne]
MDHSSDQESEMSESETIDYVETLARPSPTPPIEEEQFAIPWTGIVVNISAKSPDSEVQDGDYWLKTFANYRPEKVHMLWDEKHQTNQAMVQFKNDWDGFIRATYFERSFEIKGHGKRDWKEREQDLCSNIYGWSARRDDYNSEGPIGEYLRKETKLRTIEALNQESTASRKTEIATLTAVLDKNNQRLDALQSMYNQNAMSLRRMHEEKDHVQKAFVEKIRKMQQVERENVYRILAEQEKMNNELELRKRKIDNWNQELNKREALTDLERKKLEEDMKMTDRGRKKLEEDMNKFQLMV